MTEPKTERSKAPVPVVPLLAVMLEALRDSRVGRSDDSYIFQAGSGRPLDLDNLAKREIVPILVVNQNFLVRLARIPTWLSY